MLASLVAVAATSCMAPEEALRLQVQDEPVTDSSRYVGFAAMPDSPLVERPPVDAHEHYARSQPERSQSRGRRDWQLMRDAVDHLLGWDFDRSRCAEVPVDLPAVSRDGRVLALGMSSRVKSWHDAAVEIISTETGTTLARRELPRVANGGVMSSDEGCDAVGELAQWLEPGQFVPMRGVARTDFGFPDALDPWIVVVSDGARRERSGGNDLVVVPASAVGTETLGVQIPPDGAPIEPKAFVSEHVAVFTEYYVGC